LGKSHAESLNGILKNEYIVLPQNGIRLKKAHRLIQRWIYLYNHKRPHGSLKREKPIKLETYLQGQALEDRPIVTINY
jgi:transposase InsO family protein